MYESSKFEDMSVNLGVAFESLLHLGVNPEESGLTPFGTTPSSVFLSRKISVLGLGIKRRRKPKTKKTIFPFGSRLLKVGAGFE